MNKTYKLDSKTSGLETSTPSLKLVAAPQFYPLPFYIKLVKILVDQMFLIFINRKTPHCVYFAKLNQTLTQPSRAEA